MVIFPKSIYAIRPHKIEKSCFWCVQSRLKVNDQRNRRSDRHKTSVILPSQQFTVMATSRNQDPRYYHRNANLA